MYKRQALTSATAWLVAALVATYVDPVTGVMTLLVGGMLIFPVSVLVSKVLGASGKHRKDNPLAPLAIEGTVWMLVSIPIAIGIALYRVDWFFPAMLLIIGGRYFTFATLYGMKFYWAFGATLTAAALLVIAFDARILIGAYAGAVIEYVYGIAIYVAETRRTSKTRE